MASLPLLPGWWRLQNSTQIERCFATSNCTGGANANELCGIGYEARASTPNPNSPTPTPVLPVPVPIPYSYPYSYLKPT